MVFPTLDVAVTEVVLDVRLELNTICADSVTDNITFRSLCNLVSHWPVKYKHVQVGDFRSFETVVSPPPG